MSESSSWPDPPKIEITEIEADALNLDCGLVLPPLPEYQFISSHSCKSATLCDNVCQRYDGGFTDTEVVSNVLVRVSSTKDATAELIDSYRAFSSLEPHVFRFCFWAWQSARRRNQSIILLGRGGSGKTRTFKHILQYYQRVCSGGSIDAVVAAHRALFAFGSTSLSGNISSTRHGCLFELALDFKSDIVGATCTILPVEKWHVTSLLDVENARKSCDGFLKQNFIIFYLLLSGADVTLLKQLKLQRNPHNYALLAVPSSFLLYSGEQPKDEFTHIKEFLELLAEGESLDVWKLLAVIMKLGNLVFEAGVNLDGTACCILQNEQALIDICALIGCDVISLLNAFVRKRVEVRGEWVQTNAYVEEATGLRDRLCQIIYGRLFQWLANRVNEFLKPKKTDGTDLRELALFDSCGFQQLEENQFEQFMVNYSNERIRAFMVEMEIKERFEMYSRENVDTAVVDGQAPIYDATPVIEMCLGSLERANKQCSSSRPLTSTLPAFLDRIKPRTSDSRMTTPESTPTSERSLLFTVKHFLCEVSYVTSDFHTKNSDSISFELCDVLHSGSLMLLKRLFSEAAQTDARRSLSKSLSYSGQFKVALNTVLSHLRHSERHFVVCISPVCLPDSGSLDPTVIAPQLAAYGLDHMFAMRQHYYAFNMDYEEFFTRYRLLCPGFTWPKWNLSCEEGCMALLRMLVVEEWCYVFGASKVFLRKWDTVALLELHRKRALHRVASIIQRSYRKWKASKRTRSKEVCALIITKWVRGYLARKLFLRQKRAATVIASYYRGWKARHFYRTVRTAMAAKKIFRAFMNHCRRKYLHALAANLPSDSPISKDWPRLPCRLFCAEVDQILRMLYHRWRCRRHRFKFDQQSYFRMREKLTASLLFRDRKAGYSLTVSHPFRGDYVRIRQNTKWRRMATDTNDEYVVFADLIAKISKVSGKVSSVLLVVSTSGIIILDHRNLMVKFRVAVADLHGISLSPFCDTVAVLHLKNASLSKKKGDFLLECRHVVELVAKLYLVVQNACNKAPSVDVSPSIWISSDEEMLELVFKPSTGDTESMDLVAGCFSSSTRHVLKHSRTLDGVSSPEKATSTSRMKSPIRALESSHNHTTPSADGSVANTSLASPPAPTAAGGGSQPVRFFRRGTRLEVHL